MNPIDEHVKKGNIAKQVNNFSRCCEEYTLAVELARKQAKKDTLDHLFWWNFARAQAKLRQFEQSTQSYKQAVGLLQDGERVEKGHLLFYEQACSLVKLEQNTLALDAYNASILIQSTFKAVYRRGQLHCVLGNLELAIKDLNTAVNIRPRHAEALYTRAIVYYQNNQYTLAATDFQTCLEHESKYDNGQRFQLHHNLGNCLLEIKHFGNAKSAFAKALLLKPNEKQTRRGLKQAESCLKASHLALERSLTSSKALEKEENQGITVASEETRATLHPKQPEPEPEPEPEYHQQPLTKKNEMVVDHSEQEQHLTPFREENEAESKSSGTWDTIKSGKKQHHFEPDIIVLPIKSINVNKKNGPTNKTNKETKNIETSNKETKHERAKNERNISEEEKIKQHHPNVLDEWKQTFAVKLNRQAARANINTLMDIPKPTTAAETTPDTSNTLNTLNTLNASNASNTAKSVNTIVNTTNANTYDMAATTDRFSFMEMRFNEMTNAKAKANPDNKATPVPSLSIHDRFARMEARLDQFERRLNQFETDAESNAATKNLNTPIQESHLVNKILVKEIFSKLVYGKKR